MPGFDFEAARRAADEAIARVGANADDAWMLYARAAVVAVAEARPEFTTDAVWFLLESWDVPAPHEARAMGAVIRSMQAAGAIEPTERMHRSIRVDCHRRPLAIWRSRLFAGEVVA